MGSLNGHRMPSGARLCTFKGRIVWPDLGSCLSLYSLFPLDFQIVAKKYRDFEFPSEMTGVWRYLNNAYARDEFTNTCPADQEIEHAYSDAARRMKWCWVASCLFLRWVSEASGRTFSASSQKQLLQNAAAGCSALPFVCSFLHLSYANLCLWDSVLL